MSSIHPSIHPSIHGWVKTRPTATKTAWRGPITFGRHVSALEHPPRKWVGAKPDVLHHNSVSVPRPPSPVPNLQVGAGGLLNFFFSCCCAL